MRLLAVDFGFRRIGIAVGDSDSQIFNAKKPLSASGVLSRDALEIANLARSEEAVRVVVGLPLDPDGTEGKMARICLKLAKEIEATGFEVRMVDERLSSVQAEQNLMGAGLKASQRRKIVDGEAAILILERYVGAQAAS